MKENNLEKFMNQLMQIKSKDLRLPGVRRKIMKYIQRNRKELSKWVENKELGSEDFKRSNFKLCDFNGKTYYGYGQEGNRTLAQVITLYEIKDQQTQAGYAIVAKNIKNVKTVEEYETILTQKTSDVYEVIWIATADDYKKKGLGYLLLYTVLADSLKGPNTCVKLLDSSGGTGTQIYRNVHKYEDDSESWSEKEEFHLISNIYGEYFYTPLKSNDV